MKSDFDKRSSGPIVIPVSARVCPRCKLVHYGLNKQCPRCECIVGREVRARATA